MKGHGKEQVLTLVLRRNGKFSEKEEDVKIVLVFKVCVLLELLSLHIPYAHPKIANLPTISPKAT